MTKNKKGRVKSTQLDSKTARAKLTWSPTPYFATIDKELDVGYRKGKRTNDAHRMPGAWIMRRPRPDEEKGYVHDSLDARADDFADADGKEVLTFWQACDRARERARGGAPAKTAEAPQTIGEALTAYIATREARSQRNGRDSRYRLDPLLKDKKLAAKPIAKLTDADLKHWSSSLSDLKPATIKRTGNDLRAALASASDWSKLPDKIRGEIRVALKAPPNASGDTRHALLTDADIRRIVDAAYTVGEDFGALVLVLAATGARFSEGARITVAGLQAEAGRLIVPASAKGRGEKRRPFIPVPVGPDVIARLKEIVAGRPGHEPLLMRTDHRATKSHKRQPWAAASLMQRPWRKALEIAGIPYVEPYALRHSSIVRMLRKGIPTRITAGLHDTSIVMIERHYSAFILDAADELARGAIVSLTTAAPTPLRVAG